MSSVKRGFTLVELMIVVAIVSVLAALAISNFIRFQARSKQAEAKASLKALFSGQKALFAEKDRYSSAIGEIGFAPERGNRYAYNLRGGALSVAVSENRAGSILVPGTTVTEGVSVDSFRFSNMVLFPVATGVVGTATYATVVTGNTLPTDPLGGISGTCPNCSFAASAVGNIDNDFVGFDYHSISSEFLSIAQSACSDLQVSLAPGAAGEMKNDISCDD